VNPAARAARGTRGARFQTVASLLVGAALFILGAGCAYLTIGAWQAQNAYHSSPACSAVFDALVGKSCRYAGTATGFINMVGNLGNSAQPYIGALIFNHFGWNALFMVYAAAFCAAASMWLFINPNRRFYPEPQEPQGFEVVQDR
jgi:nitrate/nitrite transporter NarK